MRDIDEMIDLLDDMASDPGGLILLIRSLGMSPSEQKRLHNADLLEDAGLATWVSDSGIRITNDGYDFLNAVKRDRPTYTDRAKKLLEQGKSLLSVASNIIAVVNALDN